MTMKSNGNVSLQRYMTISIGATFAGIAALLSVSYLSPAIASSASGLGHTLGELLNPVNRWLLNVAGPAAPSIPLAVWLGMIGPLFCYYVGRTRGTWLILLLMGVGTSAMMLFTLWYAVEVIHANNVFSPMIYWCVTLLAGGLGVVWGLNQNKADRGRAG